MLEVLRLSHLPDPDGDNLRDRVGDTHTAIWEGRHKAGLVMQLGGRPLVLLNYTAVCNLLKSRSAKLTASIMSDRIFAVPCCSLP
jgi:hypothetical protein